MILIYYRWLVVPFFVNYTTLLRVLQLNSITDRSGGGWLLLDLVEEFQDAHAFAPVSVVHVFDAQVGVQFWFVVRVEFGVLFKSV